MEHVVFLSRGHGYGHAAQDLQSIKVLKGKRPDLKITVASYGTGYEYYVSRSFLCIDLGIPDDDDQSTNAACRILQFLTQIDKPDLVVAHEIFCAPGICKMLGLRNLLLTHWFFSEISESEAPLDQLLSDATAVIIIDFEAAHHVPSNLTVPLHFTGPITRKFKRNRIEARKKLGVPQNTFTAVATLGALTEHKMSDIQAMVRLILAAWKGNAKPKNRLFVLASPSEELEVAGAAMDESIKWVGITKMPEVYYCAADIVLSNATFTTLADLARNQVPTVALIGSLNPVDRLHAKYFESLGLVKAADLDIEPNQLWQLSREAMQTRIRDQLANTSIEWADHTSIVELILSYIIYPK